MNEHMMAYIQENVSLDEMLAQLAEEATELAHAALKLRRVVDDKNPTPVTFDEAFANLNEEIGDILLCLETLGLPVEVRAYRNDMDAKLERWVRRLKGEPKEG